MSAPVVRPAVMARTVIVEDTDGEPLLLLDPAEARALALALVAACDRIDTDVIAHALVAAQRAVDPSKVTR